MHLLDQKYVFSMDDGKTKIAKLKQEYGELRFECIAEFSLEFRYVTQHDDRLICDRFVY